MTRASSAPKGTATKHRIYGVSFGSVYPLYVAKAEKKGRTKEEVDKVIRWPTGYSQKGLEAHCEKKTDFETFFPKRPSSILRASRSQVWFAACAWKRSKNRRCGRSAIWTN